MCPLFLVRPHLSFLRSMTAWTVFGFCPRPTISIHSMAAPRGFVHSNKRPFLKFSWLFYKILIADNNYRFVAHTYPPCWVLKARRRFSVLIMRIVSWRRGVINLLLFKKDYFSKNIYNLETSNRNLLLVSYETLVLRACANCDVVNIVFKQK